MRKRKRQRRGGGGTQDWGYATAIAAAAAASLDKSKRDYYEYKCGGGISLDVRNARREIALMTISKTVYNVRSHYEYNYFCKIVEI